MDSRSQSAAGQFRPRSVGQAQTREVAMTVIWDDLTEEERTALKRMNRGPYPSLSKALAERLVYLGLAEERPGGTGINRAGRDLVIRTLLGARSD